jgi:pimeloyl-ACP methyl ester carboxylesterase
MEKNLHKHGGLLISWRRILIATFLFVLACIVFLFISLWIVSPGMPKPFLDKGGKVVTGSISEKVFITIGGVKQGMFIRGKNSQNPVLLFVHGGPAFSEYFLVDKYPSGLEDDFTVCYWEQRGGGLSFSPDIPLESMTLDQFESDVIEVTNYLRSRFGKEKIFMMAHSGGTAFAIRAAAKAPQLFSAYIGIAQITRQAESEKIAYRYMLEQYKAIGNTTAIKELEKFPVLQSDNFVLPFHMSLVRDKAMHELGIGTMRSMRSVLFDVFIPVWTCRAYTLKEKVNIWISKFSFLTKTKLKQQVCDTDLPAMVQELAVPVYFFSGKYDLTVNVDLSREYLRMLRAPIKGFYTFAESAHSPIFEEPGRLKQIMATDVKCFKADMADELVGVQ